MKTIQGWGGARARRRLMAAMSGLLVGALLLPGCTTPMDARKDAKFQNYGYTADRPVVRPTRSISSFTDSLMCMDQMLRAAQIPTTLVTSKQFPDYSSRVPVATKDMVITALSQMSRQSNAFRFVDYEVDIVRQDTVQNLTTILLNNNQMQLQRPALYFSGAIAFVDQNVISNRFDVGTSASRLDTGYSQSRNATIIGLEMHLGDFRTRTLIPGLDSANEVIIGGGGQGLDLAGRIGTYGVNFNVGRDYSLGAGGAMRTLVDLATIELVGKWARVPYWQCLTLDQTHPNFQRQMQEWFAESGTNGQFALVQSSLMSQGYLQANVPLSSDSPDLRIAVAHFQADHGIAITGVLDFNTYERALRRFVNLSADGTLVRVGWTASGAAGGSRLTAAPPPLSIDLQLENPLPPGVAPSFEEGEQVFLSATVSRASYLYCYFADQSRNVMRLLPNATTPNALVSAGLAVRIPDWMTPNPGFIMDAGKPGTEHVGCFASDRDPLDKLPAPLRGAGLKNVQGYGSLADIEAAFGQGLGQNGYVKSEMQWDVRPKRPATATAPAVPAPAPAQPPPAQR